MAGKIIRRKNKMNIFNNSINDPDFGEESSPEEEINDEQFNEKIETDKSKRLEYLLKQTSIYAHFVSKVKISDNANETPPKKSRKRSRNIKEDDEPQIPMTGVYNSTPSFIKNGEMKNYQIEGLNWLISLYDNGVNGILADEMGLGKTLQTISMLGYIKNVKKVNGPFLIIVPKSTISNWMNEIKRWCPSLTAFVLIGNPDERKYLIQNILFYRKKWDICITTYELSSRCKQNLSKINWHYLAVDEAHRLKNEESLFSKTTREFKSAYRLLITGTPLQNNLHELWALLNFLLPDIFDSADDFDSWFDTFKCLENDDRIKRLHKVCKPFMLQRFKEEVEKSLLPKKEIKIYVGLSQMQRDWYKKMLKKDIDIVNGKGETSKMRLHHMLVHLLKIASHPYIIPGAEPEPFENGEHLIHNSGKFLVLDKLLKKLKEQGSRVVIFCNLVMLLDILSDYCFMRDYNHLRLDGNTSYEERDRDIKEFNAPNSDVFIYIISTKAGGLGINLQTADVAILLQSDWNPQVDLQAIDRIHRIGQKKQVRVFRLIAEDTVEEKLIERAEVKLALNEKVLQDEAKINLSRAEIIENIRFGVDKILSNENVPVMKDEDIDAILKRCDENYLDSFRLENNNNDSTKLKNFNLENYFDTNYIYDFEGENYDDRKRKRMRKN